MGKFAGFQESAIYSVYDQSTGDNGTHTELEKVRMPFAVPDRIWKSPTLTSWGSMGTRAAGILVLMPLILRYFDSGEITLWYLLRNLAGLQVLAGMGFNSTFSRTVAYAMGGAGHLGEQPKATPREKKRPNVGLLGEIYGTMASVYQRIALIFFLASGLSAL